MKFNLKRDLKELTGGNIERVKPRQEYFLAFVNGDLKKIKEDSKIYWIKEKTGHIIFTRWATVNNHLHIVEWLYDNKFLNINESMTIATCLGHLQILNYLFNKRSLTLDFYIYELFSLVKKYKQRNLYTLFIVFGLDWIFYKKTYLLEDLYLFYKLNVMSIPKTKLPLVLEYKNTIINTVNEIIPIKDIAKIIIDY